MVENQVKSVEKYVACCARIGNIQLGLLIFAVERACAQGNQMSFEEIVKSEPFELGPVRGTWMKETLGKLAAVMRPVSLKRNEILFLQDDVPDGCYCVSWREP